MKKSIENINKHIDILLNNKISNQNIISLYIKIGEILSKIDKITYKNWFEIEDGIRKKYGLMICFSRKNLQKILKFYKYSLTTNLYLLNNDWNTYLYILRYKNYNQLIKIAVNNKLNKREMEYYIKNKEIKKIKQTYIDPSLEELQKLKDNLVKNEKI